MSTISEGVHGTILLFDYDHMTTASQSDLTATAVTAKLMEGGTEPPQTAKGIGPGSTWQELQAAYPDVETYGTATGGSEYDNIARITLGSVKVTFVFFDYSPDRDLNPGDVIQSVTVGDYVHAWCGSPNR